MNRSLSFFALKFFWAPFLFKKGCGVERCLWQMQRGEARAKQRETKQSAGFDYVLPLVMLSFHFFLYYSTSKNSAPFRSMSSPRGATKSMA